MVLAACSSQERTVRNVAQHYLDATGRYDVPDACRYCTPETADGLRMLDSTTMRLVDSSYIAKNMPAKIKITSLVMTSDTSAEISYHKHTPIAELDGTLIMVLRDGQWMAHVPIKIPAMFRQSEHKMDYEEIDQKIQSGEIKLRKVEDKE